MFRFATPAQSLRAKPYRGGMTRRQLRSFRRQSGLTKPSKVAAWLVAAFVRDGELPKSALYDPADDQAMHVRAALRKREAANREPVKGAITAHSQK